MGNRRTDLDALRILVCACVIVAHAMLIFAVEPNYHLKSAVPSPSATVTYEFMRVTTMAVFFVIAGWSAVVSLRRRSAGGFVNERVTRLVVPLLFGTIVFGSAIRYIEHSHGRHLAPDGVRSVVPPDAGFLAFFFRYISHSNLITWSHLWFLVYLVLISLLMLPLLTRLARLTPRTVLPPAPAVYLPALALAGLLAAFDGYWPFLPTLYRDWPNFAYFALCFGIGAGIAVWPGFEARMRTEAPRLLVLMLLCFAGVIWVGESTVGRVLVGLTAWCAVGAALGFAARIDPVATPAFLYLSEATMTIYIIHHLPLLLLALVVLPLALPVWIKIALITSATLVVSFTTYHLLIRPWPPMRRLMGMTGAKPSK